MTDAQFELTSDSRIATEICPPGQRNEFQALLPAVFWVEYPPIDAFHKTEILCKCKVAFRVNLEDRRNRQAVRKLGKFKPADRSSVMCSCYGRLIE